MDSCRESWIALLAEQGFAPVVAAGQATTPPRLLGRQVVVAGVSDGAIRGPAPTHLARRLQALRPQPTAGLVSGFSALALRDSLPDGAWDRSILREEGCAVSEYIVFACQAVEASEWKCGEQSIIHACILFMHAWQTAGSRGFRDWRLGLGFGEARTTRWHCMPCGCLKTEDVFAHSFCTVCRQRQHRSQAFAGCLSQTFCQHTYACALPDRNQHM